MLPRQRGHAVKNIEEMIRYLNTRDSGDKAIVTVRRGADTIQTSLTLAPWPEDVQRLEPPSPRGSP